MKSYKMKSWYQIQISYMTSHHDILVYDIISLKSYAWDMISRNHHVTYDIIVSSMKSYPWHHSQAYHTYNMKSYYMKSWYHIQISYMISHCDILVYDIISLKSYAWDMISRNQNIWFQVTYDIIVSSMKSYPWNHGQAYDVMQSCLWNHSNAYDIIDLWYHKTMIS